MNFLIDGQEKLFSELEQTIREGNALAFVGSGISMQVDYPSWIELTEQLANAAGMTLAPEDRDADGTRLTEIIQECKDRLGEAQYYTELRRVFDPNVRAPLSMLHVQILEMPFVSFPTTNVDNCHVLAKDSVRQRNIAGEWDLFPVFVLDRLRQRRIFYLHGKIENDERIRSVVLSKSEYQSAYDNNGPTREFLHYVVRRFDCVFIGYSMNDVFMAKVIQEAGELERIENKELERQGRPSQTRKHYAILPRHATPDGKLYIPKGRGRSLKPEEIDRLELQRIEREELLKRLRITPLYYRVVNDNHTTLNHLVYQLNRQLVTEKDQVPA